MSPSAGRIGRLPIWYLLVYALTSGFGGVYNTFLGVYLKDIGCTGAQIGQLLAATAVVALLSQPFWGLVGDRARSVNGLFRLLLSVSAVAVAVFPLSRSYAWLLGMMALFSFFSSSTYFLQDVITLQNIERTQHKYGTIRLGATIGFAVAATVAGAFADRGIAWLFPIAGGIYALAALASLGIPNVSGHQPKGPKMPVSVLLKNRDLVLLAVFVFFLNLGFSYFSGFFSIHYQALGADGALIGLTWTMSTLLEIPFLIFADRIVRRLGTKPTVLLAGVVMGARWLLVGTVTDVHAMLAVNLLHGLTLIVVIYCMATFINREVPMELKSTAQGFFSLIAMGVPRIVASFLGGYANDAFGIPAVFLFFGALTLASVLAFGAVLLWRRRVPPTALPPEEVPIPSEWAG